MGCDSGGTAGLSEESLAWDRYAHWPALRARLALFALVLCLVVAAFAPVEAGKSTVKTKNFVENITGKEAPERKRDDDLALYDRVIERIQNGERYYDFIAEEHRAANYPLRPGIAVRLPTLAYASAFLREPGLIAVSIFLLFAVLFVWWRKLGGLQITQSQRRLAIAFLFLGASLGLNRYFFTLHELWAGTLLVLSFGLYRPGRWGASLAVAALAVAIRELVLPFVLLMGAMAMWRRDWKEMAAWGGLTVLFLAGLAWHMQIISAQVMPDDPYGQGWLTFRGLSGWISSIALSSDLRFLPHWLAGPGVMLMMFGWTAWKSPTGLFGTFLFLGYGLLFVIAGRGDNFYWGVVIAPAMFIGLVFVPMGIKSLLGKAFSR